MFLERIVVLFNLILTGFSCMSYEIFLMLLCMAPGLYCCGCSVAKLCLTLLEPVDYSPPGSSVHGISQARILEWVVISFSKGSSQPRD